MMSSYRNHEYLRVGYSGNIPAIMARPIDPESVEAAADRLRITRLALGLSQAEIARQTGMSPATWNNAETGDNRMKIDNLLKVCRRYGFGTDWFLRGDIRLVTTEYAKRIAELEAEEARLMKASGAGKS
jgi:transcriptional regulator with XRE-family HTH domain